MATPPNRSRCGPRCSSRAPTHGTLGLLDIIARFTIPGLNKFPELNSHIVTTKEAAGGITQKIISFGCVNLGGAA